MVDLLMTILVAILVLVVVFYASGGFMGSSFAVGKHPEWRSAIALPTNYGLEPETVNIRSRDGISLAAWWFHSKQVARGTIILAHGSSSNKSGMLPRAAFLISNDYNVLDLDLRGHGESQGNYMTPGYLESLDILGAVDYLAKQNAPR